MKHQEQIYLEKFKEYLLIKAYAKTTATKTTYTATIFLEWITEQGIELETVSYNDVLAYINYKRKSGNKSRSLAIITNCLNHFFNFLIAECRIAENPVSNIKIKGIKRKVLCEILTPDELELIYKTYNSEPKQLKFKPCPPQTLNNLAKCRNKLILGLLIYQGLRTEELAKLELQNLQLREAKIIIHSGNRTEGRTLKLEAHQLFDLSDYVNVVRKEILQAKETLIKQPIANNQQLFLSVGTSLNFSNVMQKLIKQVKTTNKKVIDANQLRTSVITNWLKVHNLRKVQYMAGHRYISSTEAYQVNNIDALKEDINKYHPIG